MMIRVAGSMNPSTENNIFDRLRDRLRERPWSFCILALILVALNAVLGRYMSGFGVTQMG
jgi:hypothetical protein